MDEVIDWHFWQNMNEVKLWEAAYLACNINPETDNYRDIKSFGTGNNKIDKLLLLLKSNLSDRSFFSAGVSNIGDLNLHGVRLSEFAYWCNHIKYDIPRELDAMAQSVQTFTPIEAAPITQTLHAPIKAELINSAENPWNIVNPEDPEPLQPWFTPARYFARQLVKDDSTLLIKRELLANKTSQSLFNAGIFGRTKNKALDAGTILKAFNNVSLG